MEDEQQEGPAMSDFRFSHNGLTLNVSAEKLLSDNFDYRYCGYYQKDRQSKFSALCDKYGSDKGEIATTGHPYPWPSHTYADFYEGKFGHCRDYIRNVFECGIGTNNPAFRSSMGQAGKPGASLRVWRDYFPNAHIHGADIDRGILFREERISTFHVDQTSPDSIRLLWNSLSRIEFDLMIDDGLHTYEAGICMFEHSFSMLREAGIYIIEDVQVGALINFRNYFASRHHKVEFVNLYRPGLPLNDNSLIVIRK
jgi:hypothetical protein